MRGLNSSNKRERRNYEQEENQLKFGLQEMENENKDCKELIRKLQEELADIKNSKKYFEDSPLKEKESAEKALIVKNIVRLLVNKYRNL